MAQLLLQANATVTTCHSRTKDLPEVTRRADVLIAAVGRDRMVEADWVKPGAIVIDVGMNRTAEGALYGDVEFDGVSEVASAITPVPGGVGPMTIAMLLRNTLMAARMQAGNAGGFFQHAAALLGLCLDDFADAALMHQRGRARARRGIREQKLHVARAHLAAVKAIERALLALDAASDFERLVFVELRGRGTVRVVEEQHHLGGVARRPAAGAPEDDLVHAAGAHVLVRGLAHDPAQRLDEVRLAAAVRPDDAGEARLDQEVGRLDEGLEADDAKAREFHARQSSSPRRAGRGACAGAQGERSAAKRG